MCREHIFTSQNYILSLSQVLKHVLKHTISVFLQLGLESGASKQGKSEVAQSKVHRESTRPALLCAPDFSPLGFASEK